MNKKFLSCVFALVLMFSMFSFVACSSEEEEASPYPLVIEDNDYFTFTINEVDTTLGDTSIEFTIENKTDRDFTFDAENAIANDEYSFSPFVYTEVSGNTKANDSFYVYDDDLAGIEDDSTITIKLSYELFDSDSYSTIKNGSFTFEMTK